MDSYTLDPRPSGNNSSLPRLHGLHVYRSHLAVVGLRVQVQGLGLRVWGSGLRAQGLVGSCLLIAYIEAVSTWLCFRLWKYDASARLHFSGSRWPKIMSELTFMS